MKCDFTGEETNDYKLVGFLPKVPAPFVMANTEAARAEYARQLSSFRESEGNCNTCRHLTRRPHEKSRDGFLRGSCSKNSSTKHALLIQFHPDDPMHMTCYEGRC